MIRAKAPRAFIRVVGVGGASERDQAVLAALGRVIKEGRRRSLLTQRAVEALSGVDQTAISRMERGATAGIALVRFARVIEVLAGPSLFGQCPHAHLCPWSTGLTLEPPRTPWLGHDYPYDEYGYPREGHGLPEPELDAASRLRAVAGVPEPDSLPGPELDAASRLRAMAGVPGPDRVAEPELDAASRLRAVGARRVQSQPAEPELDE